MVGRAVDIENRISFVGGAPKQGHTEHAQLFREQNLGNIR